MISENFKFEQNMAHTIVENRESKSSKNIVKTK